MPITHTLSFLPRHKYFPDYQRYLPETQTLEDKKICNKLVITAPQAPAFVEQVSQAKAQHCDLQLTILDSLRS